MIGITDLNITQKEELYGWIIKYLDDMKLGKEYNFSGFTVTMTHRDVLDIRVNKGE